MCMAESEREERREVIFEVMCMEEWEILHGYPLANSEVASKVNTSIFSWAWALGRKHGGKKKEIWAFCS